MFVLWFRAGLLHILDVAAFDHQLFLLTICASPTSRNALALALRVTGFTVGHSLTLAAAALGVVGVSATLVEVLIPLSITLAAVLEWRSTSVPTGRLRSALITAAFGLVHGLGFAGTLGEEAASYGGLASAILPFNLGVEVGQLVVVASLLVVITLARAIVPRPQWHAPALLVGAAVGGLVLAAQRAFGLA